MTHLERVMAKVDKDSSPDGCWLWTGCLTSINYGRVCAGNGFVAFAHRHVYELLVGPIPKGLVLDHLCSVRNCVNPAHLEPVTQGENVRRAKNQFVDRTACMKGHSYTDDNTYIAPDGSRVCITCRRATQRRFHARRKASV